VTKYYYKWSWVEDFEDKCKQAGGDFKYLIIVNSARCVFKGNRMEVIVNATQKGDYVHVFTERIPKVINELSFTMKPDEVKSITVEKGKLFSLKNYAVVREGDRWEITELAKQGSD